ncbi:MAG: T9SS type A sorting domain-containing protein [Bacteroidetes bacterium]|nr:T9SS type A sorting domain-containing protein [Bacteroidota bacterium]
MPLQQTIASAIRFFLIAVIAFFSGNLESIGQWKPVTSLYGGNNLCMDKYGDLLVCAIEYGGVFVSTDNAQSWKKTVVQPLPSLKTKAWAAIEGAKIIVANDANSLNIALSQDTGNTWQYLNFNKQLYDLALFKGRLVITDLYGVHTSFDNGSSWINDSIGIGPFYIEEFEDRIYIIQQSTNPGNRMYETNDTCQTWINRNSIPAKYETITKSGDTIICADSYSQMYFTYNNGVNWNSYTMPFTHINSNSELHLNAGMLYLAHGDSLFSSINAGNTWNFIKVFKGLSATQCLPSNGEFFISSQNHAVVKFSYNTINLGVSAQGINCIYVREILCVSDTFLVANGSNLLYLSFDGGMNWNVLMPANNREYLNGHFAMDSKQILATYKHYVYRTFNWGTTWSLIDSVPGKSIINKAVIHGNDVYYATTGGVYVSKSAGLFMTKLGSITKNILSIDSHKSFIYISTHNKVYRTVAGGTGVWKSIDNGLPSSHNFYFIDSNKDKVYMGGNKGIYSCTTPDTFWSFTGMKGQNVFDLYGRNDEIFASSGNRKITLLPDTIGGKWQEINYGITNSIFTTYQIAAGENTLMMAGGYFTRGVYIRNIWDVIPTSIVSYAYQSNSLMCYPNPTNGEITVMLKPVNSEGLITVLDIHGRYIITREVKANYANSIDLDLSHLASGVYKVIYTADQVQQTANVHILK